MSRFQRVIDTAYRTFAKSAKYITESSAPFDIFIMLDMSDTLTSFGSSTRVKTGRFVCRVRTSQLAIIENTALILYQDNYYRVKSAIYADPERLEWIVDTYHEHDYSPLVLNQVTHMGQGVTHNGVPVIYTPPVLHQVMHMGLPVTHLGQPVIHTP